MLYYSAPVTGVIDPSSNEEVSMQKAVMLGIINSANVILFCTCYRCTDLYIPYNILPVTGVQISIYHIIFYLLQV